MYEYKTATWLMELNALSNLYCKKLCFFFPDIIFLLLKPKFLFFFRMWRIVCQKIKLVFINSIFHKRLIILEFTFFSPFPSFTIRAVTSSLLFLLICTGPLFFSSCIWCALIAIVTNRFWAINYIANHSALYKYMCMRNFFFGTAGCAMSARNERKHGCWVMNLYGNMRVATI